ncbi:MAG: hypothetical protein HZB42_15405 [Sphingobacteriales bacterium]|nr:hypothetical protein [Sphingobacteriales bacterium]
MQNFRLLFLVLLSAFFLSFRWKERVPNSGFNLWDSIYTITGKAKFVKHINDPCCCFIWIPGNDRFEVSYTINGKYLNNTLDIQNKECRPLPYKQDHIYSFFATVISGDISYPSVRVVFETVDSVTKRFDKTELSPGIQLKTYFK